MKNYKLREENPVFIFISWKERVTKNLKFSTITKIGRNRL